MLAASLIGEVAFFGTIFHQAAPRVTHSATESGAAVLLGRASISGGALPSCYSPEITERREVSIVTTKTFGRLQCLMKRQMLRC
jgi:hypothetical protein